jgi:hypothetical protein
MRFVIRVLGEYGDNLAPCFRCDKDFQHCGSYNLPGNFARLNQYTTYG